MRHSNNICSTLRLPHRNQHSTLSANQKFITMPKICVELWNYENTDKICLSLSICILYSILLYCMNIHLFNIVIFIFYIRWPFPSFGWFLNRSVIFKWIHTHTHTHILLIVNAHSNEIIPASLFAVINIKFLCSRVHLSHIILCRLSCCWILFVSGRLSLLCVAFFAWIFICIFHHIAFHVQMDFRLKIF